MLHISIDVMRFFSRAGKDVNAPSGGMFHMRCISSEADLSALSKGTKDCADSCAVIRNRSVDVFARKKFALPHFCEIQFQSQRSSLYLLWFTSPCSALGPLASWRNSSIAMCKFARLQSVGLFILHLLIPSRLISESQTHSRSQKTQ